MTLKTLEKTVRSMKPDQQRKFLSDLPSLLRIPNDDLLRLKAAERSFAFWNNSEDEVYDRL